jgi:hypothetical protein
MKNIYQTQLKGLHQVKNWCTKSLVKSLLIVGLISFLATPASAQKYKPKSKCYIGGGLETYSSGNWHGTLFSPYLNLTKGRRSFNMGPVMQSRSKELSGGKFSFSYNLSGGKSKRVSVDEDEEDYVAGAQPGILQLNVFGFGQYIHNTPLSKSASITEQKTSREASINWSNVRLSTAEAGVGFELYVKFSKRVSWKNFIGGSVYCHTNYIAGMYHEKISPVLFMGTGIHICPL